MIWSLSSGIQAYLRFRLRKTKISLITPRTLLLRKRNLNMWNLWCSLDSMLTRMSEILGNCPVLERLNCSLVQKLSRIASKRPITHLVHRIWKRNWMSQSEKGKRKRRVKSMISRIWGFRVSINRSNYCTLLCPLSNFWRTSTPARAEVLFSPTISVWLRGYQAKLILRNNFTRRKLRYNLRATKVSTSFRKCFS